MTTILTDPAHLRTEKARAIHAAWCDRVRSEQLFAQRMYQLGETDLSASVSNAIRSQVETAQLHVESVAMRTNGHAHNGNPDPVVHRSVFGNSPSGVLSAPQLATAGEEENAVEAAKTRRGLVLPDLHSENAGNGTDRARDRFANADTDRTETRPKPRDDREGAASNAGMRVQVEGVTAGRDPRFDSAEKRDVTSTSFSAPPQDQNVFRANAEGPAADGPCAGSSLAVGSTRPPAPELTAAPGGGDVERALTRSVTAPEAPLAEQIIALLKEVDGYAPRGTQANELARQWLTNALSQSYDGTPWSTRRAETLLTRAKGALGVMR